MRSTAPSRGRICRKTHTARATARDVAIDQVVIGSCTNGQIDDMAAAAAVLKGHHLAPGVRGIIIPATQSVYRECMHRGYTDIFLDAGCIVSTPTCGPCLGGHMGILAAGERCVSTTNRNFVGRMGHVDQRGLSRLARRGRGHPASRATSAILRRL